MSGHAPRNLVLCSDGTGNQAGKKRGTNVWRLYEALDRHCHENGGPVQLAVHDDGVGTSNVRLLALLGGAFGLGLARNVRELYSWLVENYEPGDRIYLFGFSRGAFTVRCLAGMITRFGVIDRRAVAPGQVAELVREAWRLYKETQHRDGVPKAQEFKQRYGVLLPQPSGAKPPSPDQDVPVHFLGVWDTVDAYGLPSDTAKDLAAGLTRYLARGPLHRLALTRFSDHRLHPLVLQACQAIAIDDERRTFHPLLFDESRPADQQRIEQVWFAGVHSDVGGGYARGSVSLVSLEWMISRADSHELVFARDRWAAIWRDMDPTGPIHDSRAGLSAYYRYTPRRIDELCKAQKVLIPQPKVHGSAIERIGTLQGGYTPEVLSGPWLDHQGQPIAHPPHPAALGRLAVTHRRGQAMYLMLLVWTAVLIGAAWWLRRNSLDVTTPGWSYFGYVFGALEVSVPDFVARGIAGLRRSPLVTLSLLAALWVLNWRRGRLRTERESLGLEAWSDLINASAAGGQGTPAHSGTAGGTAAGTAAGTSAGIASHEWPKRLARALRWALGWGYAVAGGILLLLVLGGLRHAAQLLPPEPSNDREERQYPVLFNGQFRAFDFETTDPGRGTDLVLIAGERYRIRVYVREPWLDDTLAAGPRGLSEVNGYTGTLGMAPFVLFRRRTWTPWFAMLASVGSVNGRRYVVGRETVIQPKESGRLFLYVNDATCYFCLDPWFFYTDNNHGTALVTVTHIPQPDT